VGEGAGVAEEAEEVLAAGLADLVAVGVVGVGGLGGPGGVDEVGDGAEVVGDEGVGLAVLGVAARGALLVVEDVDGLSGAGGAVVGERGVGLDPGLAVLPVQAVGDVAGGAVGEDLALTGTGVGQGRGAVMGGARGCHLACVVVGQGPVGRVGGPVTRPVVAIAAGSWCRRVGTMR
jgi:hypothetical protein